MKGLMTIFAHQSTIIYFMISPPTPTPLSPEHHNEVVDVSCPRVCCVLLYHYSPRISVLLYTHSGDLQQSGGGGRPARNLFALCSRRGVKQRWRWKLVVLISTTPPPPHFITAGRWVRLSLPHKQTAAVEELQLSLPYKQKAAGEVEQQRVHIGIATKRSITQSL